MITHIHRLYGVAYFCPGESSPSLRFGGCLDGIPSRGRYFGGQYGVGSIPKTQCRPFTALAESSPSDARERMGRAKSALLNCSDTRMYNQAAGRMQQCFPSVPTLPSIAAEPNSGIAGLKEAFDTSIFT